MRFICKSLLSCTALLFLGAAPTEEDILKGADARIQKHRTGELTLRPVGADGKPLPGGTQVRIEQTRHAFLFGCNIFSLGRMGSPEEDEAYARQFAELLNYATLPFYWWAYEKTPGQADYARTEELLDWCEAHGVTVKGHPLVWNYVDPKWLPDDTAAVAHLQFARVHREVNHFAGRLDLWDVVNEATMYNRAECFKNSPKLTRLIREMGVGPFVREAFKMARAANPKATLVINDYRDGADYAEKVIAELVDESGKPLYDVIGIQSHQHGGAWTVGHIWEVCGRFARFGKPLHFTETTFVSGRLGWGLADADPGFKWESTPDGEKRQADDAARFYTVLFSHPAVEAITWWDFCDKTAWQRAPAGLIGRDLKPKPAYNALKGLIKDRWWTRTSAAVGENGQATFRGFFGEYKATVGEGDSAVTGTFSFDGKTAEPIEVRLR